MAEPIVEVPARIIELRYPLQRFGAALHGRGPVRIVAMGSSSTAGREDVVPYPARLEMYLRRQYLEAFPKIRIDVLNRGRGGEEAGDELKRFATDVFADDPPMVIWQVGTNAVFHKEEYDVDEVAKKIAEGLTELRRRAMDVVLMDPQYVTAMLTDDRAQLSEKMVSLIHAAAEHAEVNLFQRWALMRHWHVHDNVSFDQLLDPTDGDKLHQSDWSTLQISKALFTAITNAAAATAS
jgi:hypothetical protein